MRTVATKGPQAPRDMDLGANAGQKGASATGRLA
jgi:hypothetical protein